MTGTPTNEGYHASNRPLIKALLGHIDALAKHGPRAHAAGWVYATVLVAWAEDHGLIPQYVREGAWQRRKQHAADGGTDATWLREGFARLGAHGATACLLDPRYSPLTGREPAPGTLGVLLDWWADEAPDLDRRGQDGAPDSITGWLVADLLQALHGDRIDGNAFSQTPWFVADFLCARTLPPASATFPNTTLRVIDPAAGAGHLLVWAALGLHQLYTVGALSRPRVSTHESVRRILTGLHGVELDPLTAAVARLRLTVLAGVLLAGGSPVRLCEIPEWVRPNVAVGNALLAGLGDACPPGTVLDDTAGYPGILARGTYHVVIANPPYKVIADRAVREAVRAAYPDVCSGQFPAGVPFTRLMFDLAIRDGGSPRGVVAGPEQLSLFEEAAASA